MTPTGTAVARPGGAQTAAASLSDYLTLVKPRVVLLILVTTLVGFALASAEAGLGIDYLLLGRALLGMALVSGGTLALNQYLERDVDARMRRTRMRPLPTGRMQPAEALVFGSALVVVGLAWLFLAVTPVCGAVTGVTVVTYLFGYTPLKRRTSLCTLVGAFPGALPPVSGWVAAGGDLGAGAAVLFGILFFWQIPHSLAIGRIYRDDYTMAGIRLLPTVDPEGGSTGRQTVLNCLALLAVGIFPTVIGLAGWAYLAVAMLMGSMMLWYGAAMAAEPSVRRARHLLFASYLYVPTVMVAMALDRTFLPGPF